MYDLIAPRSGGICFTLLILLTCHSSWAIDPSGGQQITDSTPLLAQTLPPAPPPSPDIQSGALVPDTRWEITPSPLTIVSPPVSASTPPSWSVGNRFGVVPPPGTLGRTYQRPSRLVDEDQHPRFAAVEVHLPEEVDVSARGLKSKWTGKVWRLEAETPLLPGIPHVYAIKAERRLNNGEKHVEYRWVRLIMGRVVDLEF